MPHAEVTLPGELSSVPTARRFVESILGAWGQPEHGWTAALLISELATNSTLHARTPFAVRVSLDGDAVRLEVTDGSVRTPMLRDYGTDATTGRGMRLVQDLSAAWGVEPQPAGKTVWASIRPSGEAHDDEDADVDQDLDAVLLRLTGGVDDGPGGPGLRLLAA